MENDVNAMAEVKDWLQEGSKLSKRNMNDLFGAVNLGGRMKLEQEEDEPSVCVPIEEVRELLAKCACELGMKYEQ